MNFYIPSHSNHRVGRGEELNRRRLNSDYFETALSGGRRAFPVCKKWRKITRSSCVWKKVSTLFGVVASFGGVFVDLLLKSVFGRIGSAKLIHWSQP